MMPFISKLQTSPKRHMWYQSKSQSQRSTKTPRCFFIHIGPIGRINFGAMRLQLSSHGLWRSTHRGRQGSGAVHRIMPKHDQAFITDLFQSIQMSCITDPQISKTFCESQVTTWLQGLSRCKKLENFSSPGMAIK
jgi:hypothetical protein